MATEEAQPKPPSRAEQRELDRHKARIEDENSKEAELTERLKASMIPRTAIIRLHAWSVWLPQEDDPNNPNGKVARGSTAIKLLPGETIIKLDATTTPFEATTVREVDDGSGGVEEVESTVQFVGMEALTAWMPPSNIDLTPFLDPQPEPDESKQMVEEYIEQQKKKQREMQVKADLRGHRVKGGMPRL